MSARTAGRRSKPSHTAAKVARGVIYLARDPVHASLYPVGAAESIEQLALEAGAIKPWMIRLFEQRWYRRLVGAFVDWFGPGELMRLTLRKRFVDDEVRSAIAEGAEQVLIVGAGFDTLGQRVSDSFPDVTVVEVDAPATAPRRQTALERMGVAHENHHLEAVDLATTTLGEVLGRVAAWKADRRSVIVAEGVLMYLSASEVAGFLAEIRSNAGDASRLVFSYLYTDERGRPVLGKASWISRVSLRLVGEPLRWGVRNDEALTAFLEENGFRLIGPSERFDLQRRYLTPMGITQAIGQMERMVVAEVAGAGR